MLELQGYAHAYFDPAWDRDLVFSERAFDWAIENMRSMRLLFEHEDIVKLASRRDGTLAVWADDIGLAFEALVQSRAFASLNQPLYRLGCSFRGRIASVTRGIQARRQPGDSMDELLDLPVGRIVNWCAVDEITLTDAPAYPNTAVWLKDTNEFDLPPRVAALRDCWLEGRRHPRQPLPSPRPAAPPRRPRPQPTPARAAAAIARDTGDMLHLIAEDWGWSSAEISWIRTMRAKAARFGMFAVA